MCVLERLIQAHKIVSNKIETLNLNYFTIVHAHIVRIISINAVCVHLYFDSDMEFVVSATQC